MVAFSFRLGIVCFKWELINLDTFKVVHNTMIKTFQKCKNYEMSSVTTFLFGIEWVVNKTSNIEFYIIYLIYQLQGKQGLPTACSVWEDSRVLSLG